MGQKLDKSNGEIFFTGFKIMDIRIILLSIITVVFIFYVFKNSLTKEKKHLKIIEKKRKALTKININGRVNK